jgi:hypothetical protein
MIYIVFLLGVVIGALAGFLAGVLASTSYIE